MRIDSGTTTEHRVRLGIFLAMLTAFAAYFGYDGLWGYPAKNLEWARQNIQDISPEQKAKIQTNPKVMFAQLKELDSQIQTSNPPTQEQVKTVLGEPGAVVERPGGATGSGDAEVWYVGPAACARLTYSGGKLASVNLLQNINKSEGDIWLQKVLGVCCGIAALGMGIYYIRIMTMRTVLDDTGLRAKGRHVAWDEMAELDTSDYQRKGWLDLVYQRNGDTGSVRLDSYHIASFDEIVNTICERKGFTSPIKPKHAEVAEEEAG